jgi:hypothetical protein
MKGTDRYRVEGVTCRVGEQPLNVVNLSVSGFFVESSEPPPVASSLEVQLTLPGEEPTSIVGTVVWINDTLSPRHSTLPPGFGFRMQRIPFAAKMAVLKYLRGTHPSALRDR